MAGKSLKLNLEIWCRLLYSESACAAAWVLAESNSTKQYSMGVVLHNHPYQLCCHTPINTEQNIRGTIDQKGTIFPIVKLESN